MRFAMFYHSLVSDWNHGNAHFLRGVVSELHRRGYKVDVYEPRDGWSRQNLVRSCGLEAIARFGRDFPGLRSTLYDLKTLDLDVVLNKVDVIIVHEWTPLALVERLEQWRKRRPEVRLFFHDTHHRSVNAPAQMTSYDLSAYDEILTFGEVIRQVYLRKG